MANRYWIGGSGNWSDTAHWSTTSGGTGGASVPSTTDDVIVDANSGSAAFTITLNVNVSIRSFSCSNSYCTLSAGSRTITMNGGNWNWSAGTFDYGTSTFVVASGTTVCYASGSSNVGFWNLTINEGATCNMQGSETTGHVVINTLTCNGTLTGNQLFIRKAATSSCMQYFGTNAVLNLTNLCFYSTYNDISIITPINVTVPYTGTGGITIMRGRYTQCQYRLLADFTITVYGVSFSTSNEASVTQNILDCNGYKLQNKTTFSRLEFNDGNTGSLIEVYGYGGFHCPIGWLDGRLDRLHINASYGAQYLNVDRIKGKVILFNRGYNNFWRVGEKLQNPPLNQPLNQCFALLTNYAYGVKTKPG